MQWEDSPPRQAINLGAAFGVPNHPTLFQVCILQVLDCDPLLPALGEFWRRVLTDGPPACSPGWQVLLIESWPDSGGFTAAFTRIDLGSDEPPVFKFRSVEMERLWYDLPDERLSFDSAAEELERRWIAMLVEASRQQAVVGLLAELRQLHPTPVWLTNQTRSKHWTLEV
jgi:hypothetical protein